MAHIPGLIYPSWIEWWKTTFPDADKDSICPRQFLSRETSGCWDLRCTECENRPIPAEIAAKLGVKPKSEIFGVRTVKRWARPGDWVMATATCDDGIGPRRCYEAGDILQIIRPSKEVCACPAAFGLAFFEDEYGKCLTDDEYVVLEGYKPPTPPRVREVKRFARPGEWIKIVNAGGYAEDEYKNGDILQVVEGRLPALSGILGMAFYKNENRKLAYPHEYVVLEGYEPSKA